MRSIHRSTGRGWGWVAGGVLVAAILCTESMLQGKAAAFQVEIVPGSAENYIWVNSASIDGHLSLNSSPAGAFSPNGTSLAVASKDKIVLSDLGSGTIQKVLHPKIENVRGLDIQSANFLDPNTLFLLGAGTVHERDGLEHPTPLLGLEWNIEKDAISGDISVIGAKGGFGRPRYFPRMKYLAMYKDSQFILWSPITRKAVGFKIPELTREPHLYSFSPDGHWLLLAQISGGGSPNPVVVELSEHKFVDVLSGYPGSVMSMCFSSDGKKLVTTSADGKIRIWSVPGWKLLETLSGHQGPVRWAEFSPDGNEVVSGGEDTTVRIWSVNDGELVQTLKESHSPVDTVGFSPDGNYVVASTDSGVLVWKKTSTDP